MKLRIFFLVLLLGGFGIVAAQTAPTSELMYLEHDDLQRAYVLTTPAEIGTGAPLIIALHEFGSSATALQAFTGLDAAAHEGAIIAYPQAHAIYWDDGRVLAGLPPTREQVDDVGFVLAMLDELQAVYDIGPIYITGMGNGGVMAQRVVCSAPDRLTAAVIVGARMWNYLDAQCGDASASVDLLFISGDDDISYPVEGRSIVPDIETLYKAFSVEENLTYWAERQSCDVAFDLTENPTVLSCADDTTLANVQIVGGGHNWHRTGDGYQLNQVGVDTTALVLSFFNGGDAWRDVPTRTMFDGPPRTYRTYAPLSYTGDAPLPLVIALHGRTANGGWMALATDFNRVAEEENFLMVYPDGIDGGWSYLGDLMPDNFDARVDDTVFLPQLKAELAQDFNVDLSRVYVTGFSNGGFMTIRAACDNVADFAAFAAVSGTNYPNTFQHCEDADPAPLLFIQGTEDVSVPWNGSYQMLANTRIVVSYPFIDTVRYWVNHNRCSGEAVSEILPNQAPDSRVIYSVFGDCAAEGAPVVTYIVENGGHNWPGVPGVISDEIAGIVNMDIHAAEVIWAFFAQHALAP